MSDDIKEIQQRLVELGHAIAIDGELGPQTSAAIMAELAQAKPDVGAGDPPPTPVPAPAVHTGSYQLDVASAVRLKQAHPELQRLMNRALDTVPFQVLQSQRGRNAQEEAFRLGHSKAHFGQSAHNWTPSVALDIAPPKLDWSKPHGWLELQDVIGFWDGKSLGKGLALRMRIKTRWGGDWNFNGIADERLVDLPHYELHPWPEWAKGCKLYEG